MSRPQCRNAALSPVPPSCEPHIGTGMRWSGAPRSRPVPQMQMRFVQARRECHKLRASTAISSGAKQGLFQVEFLLSWLLRHQIVIPRSYQERGRNDRATGSAPAERRETESVQSRTDSPSVPWCGSGGRLWITCSKKQRTDEVRFPPRLCEKTRRTETIWCNDWPRSPQAPHQTEGPLAIQGDLQKQCSGRSRRDARFLHSLHPLRTSGSPRKGSARASGACIYDRCQPDRPTTTQR